VTACDDDDDLPSDETYSYVKRGVDFSEYKTFHVDDELTQEDLADAGVDIEDFPEDVKANIDVANDQARLELEAQGLEEVGEDEEPDLIIASLGSTKEQDAIYWDCVPGSWWGYWGWYWDDCAWIDPDYVQYTIGSVVLGVSDPEMKKIVFGGLLRGLVTGSGDAEPRIRSGVHELFKSYPDQ
jgi:hypothetical protein